jgi:hypothetical protein
MSGLPWIDVPATVGESADYKDFQLAVHCTLFWAQDFRSGPIWTTFLPKMLATELSRRAEPLDDEQLQALAGNWPPEPADLDLTEVPKLVKMRPVAKGEVGWSLEERQFLLRKRLHRFTSDVRLWIDQERDRIFIRQTVSGGVTGVPRNLKMISAAIGLYDGDVRMLPTPIEASTPDDIEDVMELLLHADRQQPIWLLMQSAYDDPEAWWSQVQRFARESFGLQHVVAVTVSGIEPLHHVLGQFTPAPGAIRTFNVGFSLMDDPLEHPLLRADKVREYGLAASLEFLHQRRMRREAMRRKYGG